MKLRVALILCVTGFGASAQTPGNVNDCTLLPDPVALKRCVDGFGPQSLRSSNTLPLPTNAPESVQPEVRSKIAPQVPAEPRSDAWLHDRAAVPNTRQKPSDAIQLNE